MLRQRKLRRTLGALLLIAGGFLMWLAPQGTFGQISISGLVLMIAGIALEFAGIAMEHREQNRRP
jgi:drug/metabolite transporter (DMT)-like permease